LVELVLLYLIENKQIDKMSNTYAFQSTHCYLFKSIICLMTIYTGEIIKVITYRC